MLLHISLTFADVGNPAAIHAARVMAGNFAARQVGVSLRRFAVFIFSAVSSPSVIFAGSLDILARQAFIAMKDSQDVGPGDSVSQAGGGSCSPSLKAAPSKRGVHEDYGYQQHHVSWWRTRSADYRMQEMQALEVD